MEPDAFDLAGFCIGVGERVAAARRDGGAGGRRDRRPRLERAPRQRLLAGAGAGRGAPAGPRRPVDGARARRARRGRRRCARRRHAGRRAADAHPDLRAGPARDPGGARAAEGHEVRGMAHITGGGLPGQRAARAAGAPRGADGPVGVADAAGDARRSARWAGSPDAELRATFNGGLGMIVVVPAAAATLTRGPGVGPGHPGLGRWRGRRRGGDRRAVRGGGARPVSGRIAVGVSGTGSNLRALVAAAGRGVLGGDVVLVFADRAVPRPRLGGGAGDRHDPGPRGRRRGPRGDAARRSSRMPWCWRGTCGWSGRRCWRPSTGGSSTSTRRCCRRSRGSTGPATRSRPAWP